MWSVQRGSREKMAGGGGGAHPDTLGLEGAEAGALAGLEPAGDVGERDGQTVEPLPLQLGGLVGQPGLPLLPLGDQADHLAEDGLTGPTLVPAIRAEETHVGRVVVLDWAAGSEGELEDGNIAR